MTPRWLYGLSFFIASMGAIAVVACAISIPLRDVIAWPVIWVECGMLVTLFFRGLFDSRVIRGADTVSRAMNPNGYLNPSKFDFVDDPNYGLFGKMVGTRAIQYL